MPLYRPDGKPIRSFGAFGTRRKLEVGRLQAGMMLCEPVVGARGNILMCEGEVLTQKHVDQLQRWIARPGAGCLLNYTREVWVKAVLGSGDERPKCETDPYAAHSIQKLYKRGMKASEGPRIAKQSAARAVYKMGPGGNLIEVHP